MTNRTGPRVLLGILAESQRPINRTRLMKLLFLVREETLINSATGFYDFLPYKYGPYSFVADRELRRLTDAGLVSGRSLCVPDEARSSACAAFWGLPAPLREGVRELVQRYESWPDAKLVDDVYARYPAYALLSERGGRSPSRAFAQPAAYTIGYQGRSVDAFLSTLIRTGIARLIDVRYNALSRRYGFSRKTLFALCEKVGVEYLHIPELGVESGERKGLSSLESYRRLLDWYEGVALPDEEEALRRAGALIEEMASALMCYEADVRCCHRGRLAAHLASITHLPIRHLGEYDG